MRFSEFHKYFNRLYFAKLWAAETDEQPDKSHICVRGQWTEQVHNGLTHWFTAVHRVDPHVRVDCWWLFQQSIVPKQPDLAAACATGERARVNQPSTMECA